MLLAASAATSFSQAARRSGVINGKALTDDGQPAADAQIIAFPAGGKIGDHLQTICDEEGNFKLTSLRSGAYAIHVSAPGYVSSNSSETQVYRAGENVLISLVKGGVITGRVTDAAGEPIVGIAVQAQKTRDLEGRRGSIFNPANPAESAGHRTDDRGIYRIYGLEPGVYLVKAYGSASGFLQSFDMTGSTSRETPTYYPSSNHDAAVEVTIRGGEEVSGIDIRQRSERGFVVSGVLSGELESDNLFNAVAIGLRNPANGSLVAMTAGVASGKFAVYGVPNGEYEIFAFRSNESNDRTASLPRRVVVKGADVSGIDLRLMKLGVIGGRVVIEAMSPDAGCAPEEPLAPEDLTVRTQRSDKGQGTPVFDDFSVGFGRVLDFGVPNSKGEFVLRNLDPGRHRLLVDLPGDNYYVRSVTQIAAGRRATAANVDLARNGIALRQGETTAGVVIVISPGAASLAGRIASGNEGQAEAARGRMRISLIPAEPAAAEDVLRYYESATRSDNSFEFKHLAPGKYLLLARPVAENDDPDHPPAWDPAERAKLRRAAEVAKQEIELKPCTQLKNYAFTF